MNTKTNVWILTLENFIERLRAYDKEFKSYYAYYLSEVPDRATLRELGDILEKSYKKSLYDLWNNLV